MTNQRIGESIPDMLNEAAIQQYEEDGVAVLRNVISSDWREKLAEAIECDIEYPGPYVHAYQAEDGAGRFHGNLRIWENDPDFRAYCFESPLPEMAATIFGSTHVNLHYDQLFV